MPLQKLKTGRATMPDKRVAYWKYTTYRPDQELLNAGLEDRLSVDASVEILEPGSLTPGAEFGPMFTDSGYDVNPVAMKNQLLADAKRAIRNEEV